MEWFKRWTKHKNDTTASLTATAGLANARWVTHLYTCSCSLSCQHYFRAFDDQPKHTGVKSTSITWDRQVIVSNWLDYPIELFVEPCAVAFVSTVIWQLINKILLGCFLFFFPRLRWMEHTGKPAVSHPAAAKTLRAAAAPQNRHTSPLIMRVRLWHRYVVARGWQPHIWGKFWYQWLTWMQYS